jgi:hypothetical protein
VVRFGVNEGTFRGIDIFNKRLINRRLDLLIFRSANEVPLNRLNILIG